MFLVSWPGRGEEPGCRKLGNKTFPNIRDSSGVLPRNLQKGNSSGWSGGCVGSAETENLRGHEGVQVPRLDPAKSSRWRMQNLKAQQVSSCEDGDQTLWLSLMCKQWEMTPVQSTRQVWTVWLPFYQPELHSPSCCCCSEAWLLGSCCDGEVFALLTWNTYQTK